MHSGPRPCWKCGQPVQWHKMFFHGHNNVRGICLNGSRLAPAAHLTTKGKHWVVCKGSRVPANSYPLPTRTTISRKELSVLRWREKKSKEADNAKD